MCCMIIKMFAKWRAQHSHNNADKKGVPPLLPHSPFTALGSVGFASARFSSVLFVGYLALGRRLLCSPLLPLLLLPPALTWHCLLCNHLHPRNDSFYLLLAAAAAAASFSTYNGNMHVSNYGAQKPAKQLQQQLWNNRKLLAADDHQHHHHHHRCSEWWTTKRAKCEPCADASVPLAVPANAVLQCKYSHRKWKYSWVHAEYKTKGLQKTQA